MREALTNPRFQQLDDPPELLIKELNVSTVHLMCCSHVEIVKIELCYLIHTINIFSHSNRSRKNIGGHGSVWEGLMDINDEKVGAEVGENEEDKEVQKIMYHGRAVKCKILTGNTVYKMYVEHVKSV